MNAGEFYDPELAPFYEAGARRAEAMLRSAVSLELRDPPRSAAPGATIQVTARITNLSGHRVPTGYADGRRMWLDVALVDAEGRETVVSGAYDAAQARLTEDPQLKLYETHHGRAGMGYSFHIALNNTIVYDTRLPPRGYRPLPGHEPVGADYSGGENGTLRHWDDARYNITIPATARGAVRVRVRARYQSTVREFIDFLAAENRTDSTGRDLQRLYEASNRAPPFDMAEATAQISLGGATTDGGVRDGAVADVATLTPATASGGASCAASPARGVSSSPLALLAGALGLALARRRRRG
jgi:MYXO-CTERM domain-containing protein